MAEVATGYSDEPQVSSSGQHLVSEGTSPGLCSKFHSLLCRTEEGKKLAYGLLLVFSIAFSWVGAQQFSQSAVLSENFNAPYFTVWFSTCWMTLCFPAYSLLLCFTETRARYWTTLNEAKMIFADHPIPGSELFCKVFGFTFLWVATNYCYVFSLSYIASTDASAIISSNVAIVYIMSLALLKERFYILRILATALSIAGVVLFAYADGYGTNSNMVGVLLAVLSAFGSAGYKVLFKRAIWRGTLGQVCLFLSILGILNATILWIVFVILYFTGVEGFSASDIPWDYLCGSSTLSLRKSSILIFVCLAFVLKCHNKLIRKILMQSLLYSPHSTLVFNFLVNFGVAYTYPLFISIAMMLGIPINALIDFLVRGILFSVTRLVAALLIIFSFIFTMFPDSFNYPIHRFFCFQLPRCDFEEPQPEMVDEKADYTAGKQQQHQQHEDETGEKTQRF